MRSTAAPHPTTKSRAEARRWRSELSDRLAERLVQRPAGGRSHASSEPAGALWWSEPIAGEEAPEDLLATLLETADEPRQRTTDEPPHRPGDEQDPITAYDRAAAATFRAVSQATATPQRGLADEDPASPGNPAVAIPRVEPRPPLWPTIPPAPGSLVFELASEEAAEDDLGALADRISRILREEARRHGVDV